MDVGSQCRTVEVTKPFVFQGPRQAPPCAVQSLSSLLLKKNLYKIIIISAGLELTSQDIKDKCLFLSILWTHQQP